MKLRNKYKKKRNAKEITKYEIKGEKGRVNGIQGERKKEEDKKKSCFVSVAKWSVGGSAEGLLPGQQACIQGLQG